MTSRYRGHRPDGDILREGEAIRVFIFDAGQCDPKRCSARRLVRMGLAEQVTKLSRLPRKAILLDPYAKRALSPEDGVSQNA